MRRRQGRVGAAAGPVRRGRRRIRDRPVQRLPDALSAAGLPDRWLRQPHPRAALRAVLRGGGAVFDSQTPGGHMTRKGGGVGNALERVSSVVTRWTGSTSALVGAAAVIAVWL